MAELCSPTQRYWSDTYHHVEGRCEGRQIFSSTIDRVVHDAGRRKPGRRRSVERGTGKC